MQTHPNPKENKIIEEQEPLPFPISSIAAEHARGKSDCLYPGQFRRECPSFFGSGGRRRMHRGADHRTCIMRSLTHKSVTGWPIRRQRQPTRGGRIPPCLRHRQCPSRIGIGIRRRSLSPHPSPPSTRLPPSACGRPRSSSPGTVVAAAGAPVRWQGSAGWSCGGIRRRGSSGCREETGERRRRGSEQGHHPTVMC